jgi:GNAT superfamily N-acetyltransferase
VSHGGASASHLHGQVPAYAVGFATLVPSYSSLRLGRSWLLTDLFVTPAVRNRGVASLMLAHARRFATEGGAVQIDLHATVHNPSMQRMFARQDFQKETEHAVFTHVLPAASST